MGEDYIEFSSFGIITGPFNHSFNSYIAAHDKIKITQTHVTGGLKDLHSINTDSYYHISEKLKKLRDEFLINKKVNRENIKSLVDDLQEILELSEWHEEFIKCFSIFLSGLNKRYGTNHRIRFQKHKPITTTITEPLQTETTKLETKDSKEDKKDIHDPKYFIEHIFENYLSTGNNKIADRLVPIKVYILSKNKVNKEMITYVIEQLAAIANSNISSRNYRDSCEAFIQKIDNIYSLNFFAYWNENVKPIKPSPPVEPPIIPPKNTPQKNSIKRFYPVIVILLLGISIIITLFFMADMNSQLIVYDNVSAVKNTSINQTLTSNISLKDYVGNPYDYDGKQATLKAYLRLYIKGDGTAGVYTNSIIDDGGNNIDLMNIDNTYKKLFPSIGVTKEVYELSGVFKRSYKTILFKPDIITLSQKNPDKVIQVFQTKEVIERIPRNVTTARFPLLRKIVYSLIGKSVSCEDGTILGNCSIKKPFICSYNGLEKNAAKCGCPNGQRLYKGNCIDIVKCSDNTLEPDCSVDKPKQCLGGNLINNSDLCGCPQGDFKKTEKSCVKILRCKDNTIYNDCSTNKPLFCQDGQLVKNSDKCGCNWGSEAWDGDCLDSQKVEGLRHFDYLKDINVLENRVHVLINLERTNAGLGTLQWNDKIHDAAVLHSKDMVTRNYFEHDDPDGHDFSWRYSQVGFACNIYMGNTIYKGAENIAQNNLYTTIHYTNGIVSGYDWNTLEDLAQGIVQQWMNSAGHRANILNSVWKTEAIGIAVSADDKVYVTEDFC